MKKLYLNLSIFVFIIGVAIFITNKIEAAVTAWIGASPSTSVTVGSDPVTISYGSNGADSCSVKLNGNQVSSSNSGFLTLGTTTAGTYTYTITCTHTTVDPNTYYKLCPVTSGAGTYYTARTSPLNSGQKVTGAVWCDSFYEYTVCGSSSNPNTYSAYGQIGITPSVCAAHQ